MIVHYKDYNNAGKVLDKVYNKEWAELVVVLERMPLFIKPSDQSGKVGQFIFNPVGTNHFIKENLQLVNWQSDLAIPKEFSFLGKGVDFFKEGIVTEVQFSNYPFLLNNVVRSELLYKSKTILAGKPPEILLMITKAHMFPSSNSTLYYEQAQSQLDSLILNNVFDIPIRLVGLFVEPNVNIEAKSLRYSNARYSRKIVTEETINCKLISSKTEKGICKIVIH